MRLPLPRMGSANFRAETLAHHAQHHCCESQMSSNVIGSAGWPPDSFTCCYRCPVCSAPKKRFAVYKEPVNRNVNSTATRKARKEELQSG